MRSRNCCAVSECFFYASARTWCASCLLLSRFFYLKFHSFWLRNCVCFNRKVGHFCDYSVYKRPNERFNAHEYALCISHSRIRSRCSQCCRAFGGNIHSGVLFSSLQLIRTTHLRTSAEGKKPSHFEPTLMYIAAFGIYSVYVWKSVCVCTPCAWVYLCAVCTFKPAVCLWICWIADNVNETSTPMNIWAPKCKRTNTHINGWVDRWMDECVCFTCAFYSTFSLPLFILARLLYRFPFRLAFRSYSFNVFSLGRAFVFSIHWM